MKRMLIIFTIVIGLTITAQSQYPPKQELTQPDIKDCVLRLLAGNKRYVEGNLTSKKVIQDRAALTTGQHPYAIVLCCSDSRVPPELIFDESLGQLFVVRVAGNVVDSTALGSMEYAAEHLKVPLLMVLGHSECGAVKAALSGGEVTPNIKSLVNRLNPAITLVKQQIHDDKNLVSQTVEQNVREQMNEIMEHSEVMEELVGHGELKVIGGVYDLGSGKVKFLGHDSKKKK
jgi:carbonic anhydrase